jgi:hypothetical protein
MTSRFHSLLTHVQKVTFVEILATVCVSIMFVAIGILYEARTSVIQRYIVPETQQTASPLANQLVLSPESMEMVAKFAKAHTEVAMVGVVSVNMTANQRTNLLRVYNDKVLEQVVAQRESKESIPYNQRPFPLFSDNITQNTMISSLLAGEFTCSATDNAMFSPQYNLEERMKTSCRVPIPPFYGRFTGYLIMHSSRELSIYEVEELKAASLRLSIDMYYTDIVRPIAGKRVISGK